MNLEEKYEHINYYVGHFNTHPLEFRVEPGLKITETDISLITSRTENKNLEDLTLNCLFLTSGFPSFNPDTNLYETLSNRRRSSLDIWRHVKYFKPEATIFDIMAILYKNRSSFHSNYCSQVYRRVFKFPYFGDVSLRTFDSTYHDEYGLSFIQWKNLSTEEEWSKK